jgi:hypothetical protein
MPKRFRTRDALGKTWLLTIEDATWHASGGEHVTTIGPLSITPGAYAAQYMEAIFTHSADQSRSPRRIPVT